MNAHLLSATGALAEMAAGRLSAPDLTRACLALLPKAPDEAAAPRPVRLSGLPIAVKDVIATADRPMTHTSPLSSGHRPAADAAVVALMRAEGTIVLGKTDTTEFAAAGRDAVTANPHDLARTPGGSSAGSAVADFHVPLALSTQTGGSTIRRASYCGIPAFKPSRGLISTAGVKRYAVSFDTIGFHARAVADLALTGEIFDLPGGVASAKPQLGLCLMSWAEALEPEMRAALAALGLPTQPFVRSPAAGRVDALHRTIRGAAAFRNLARATPTALHDDFHARVELREGQTPRAAFEAQMAGRRWRGSMRSRRPRPPASRLWGAAPAIRFSMRAGDRAADAGGPLRAPGELPPGLSLIGRRGSRAARPRPASRPLAVRAAKKASDPIRSAYFWPISKR